MVALPWSSSRLSYGERLLLIWDGNAGYSFRTKQGKDPSSRASRRKRGSSGCERDSRASSQLETGMSGNFLSFSKGVNDPWMFQRLGEISLETPQRKRASSRLRGETPGFSLVAAGALDLRRGPQGPALLASGKASPHASCSGACRDSSPVDAGAYDLVLIRCRNLRIPLQC